MYSKHDHQAGRRTSIIRNGWLIDFRIRHLNVFLKDFINSIIIHSMKIINIETTRYFDFLEGC